VSEGVLAQLVAAVLKVPPRPDPPAGDPGTLRVFNAAPGFFRYRLLGWAVGQAGTAVGLLVGLLVLSQVELESLKLAAGLLRLLELLGVATYLLQLPFTYLVLRLDFRYRWYMVTDTSLRIREGILRVREQTMTFANIQNLSIRQGPLQRLFGIADLRVRSAGGGSEHAGKGEELAEAADMHLSFFRGVDNAEQIRDLIMDRMRGLSDTGLGDPDEVARRSAAGGSDQAGVAQALAAARELRAEARRLREAMTR
jgi:membrane protein YdbS with pleckstrin-like domain